MGAITVSDLEYGYPSGDTLFFDLSFKVAQGEHAALIGTNGVGKSTLLRIVAGKLEPVAGTVNVDPELLYMPQDIGLTESQTVREMLLDLAPGRVRAAGLAVLSAERRLAAGDAEAGIGLGHALGEWSELGGYQLEAQWDASIRRVVRSTLDEVGTRRVLEISGGERKQLVLDFALSCEAPTLLLDEPDNYLDVPAKDWLAAKLGRSTKTVLMISHDRELLTSAVSKVITQEADGCWVHGHSYATYPEARERRQELLGDALQRWKDEERRLYRFMKIMKQRAALNSKMASKADAAETRWHRWVDDGPPPAPAKDQRIHVRLTGGDSARKVITMESLAIPGLVEAFSDEIHFEERIGVVGPNGSGKTHLLKLLAGEPIPHTGETRLGPRVSPGLFTQFNVRPDFLARKVLDVATELTSNHEKAMQALARYGLAGVARQPYETLSGGQKARLEILSLELEGHNLLLLDEPTDNLDIDSSEALESALDQFEGTVVAVSHDRAFLRKLDRYLLILHDGRVFELSDYESALQALTAPDSIGSVRAAKLLSSGGAAAVRR